MDNACEGCASARCLLKAWTYWQAWGSEREKRLYTFTFPDLIPISYNKSHKTIAVGGRRRTVLTPEAVKQRRDIQNGLSEQIAKIEGRGAAPERSESIQSDFPLKGSVIVQLTYFLRLRTKAGHDVRWDVGNPWVEDKKFFVDCFAADAGGLLMEDDAQIEALVSQKVHHEGRKETRVCMVKVT